MVDSHLLTSCTGSGSMNSGKYSGNLEIAIFEISLCNEIHIFTHLGLFAKILWETCSISWLGKANARTNVSHEVISMEYNVHLAVNWIHCLMLWVQLRFLAFFFGFDRFVTVWNFKNYEIFRRDFTIWGDAEITTTTATTTATTAATTSTATSKP